MIPAEVQSYNLSDTVQLIRCRNRNQPDTWKIGYLHECLNHDLRWEYESMPSSRTEEYLKRCRWDSAEEAYEAWERFNIDCGL